jgi:hypothetical protein
MLITIDGSVYKYDLSTREMIFSFKTQAMTGMQLYHKDQRLIAADSSQMKLWEFVNENDDAPELKTVQQQSQPLFKIQQIVANRDGGDSMAAFHVVTSKNEFHIYDENLDILSKSALPAAPS